jgi:hypothetical protein
MSAAQQIQQSRANVEQTQATTAKINSETMDRALNTAYLASKVKETQTAAQAKEEEIPGIRGDAQTKLLRMYAEAGSQDAGPGFAADVAKRKAEATLAGLQINEAKTFSDYYTKEGAGQLNPYLQTLNAILRGASTAKRIGQ